MSLLADRIAFRQLVVAHFLSYAGYMALTPVLAVYFVSLGHDAAFVGLTVAVFSVVSILARPLAGHLVDRLERARVYGASAGVMGLGSLGYLVPFVPAFVAARVVQGSAWAVLNTAAPAIAVGMAPDNQRARAIGMLNMGRNAAIPIAPAAGLWLATTAGYGWAFLVIAAVGLLSAVVALRLHRAYSQAPRPAIPGRWKLSSLIVPSALVPAAIQSLVFAGAPLLYTFVPLYGRSLGVNDVGLVYVAAGITMIVVQPLARLSDRFGRASSITVGVALASAGLFAFTRAADLAGLSLSAALWASGSALVEPSTTALVVDRASVENRGAALATYTAAFQVGNAFGATLWGALIVSQGFGAAFGAGAVTTAAAVLFVAVTAWRRSNGG